MTRFNSVILLFLAVHLIIEARAVNSRFKYNRKNLKANDKQPLICKELPVQLLNDILGPAFNSRYMSLDPPLVEEEFEVDNPSGKRYHDQNIKPFYVDDTYAMELSNEPAWEANPLDLERGSKREISDSSEKLLSNSTRTRRDYSYNQEGRRKTGNIQQQQQKRPWECEAKIKWLDLGRDYYPRYLRTVECTRHPCFYGQFTCTPRSFTVKILRRRRGECVQTKHNVGSEGLHGDLKELWIWEERAVNFCCDCAAS